MIEKENFLPIKTERLAAEITRVEDVDLILKLDRQMITQKYLGGIKETSKEERIEYLKEKELLYKEGKSMPLTIYLGNKKIGLVELKFKEEVYLSYIFDYDYCNHGYCSEICRKIIDIAFKKLKIDTIYADVIEENISSIKVLEKLGFKYQKKYIKDTIPFLNYKLSKTK